MTAYRSIFLLLPIVFLLQAEFLADQSAPQWIWSTKATSGNQPHFFSKIFDLPEAIKEAKLLFTCDNRSEVFLNGKSAGSNPDWQQPVGVEVKKLLKPGANLIVARAQNRGGVAAFALELKVTTASGKKLSVVTDESWLLSEQETKDWKTQGVTAGRKPIVHGKMGMEPWGDVFAGGGRKPVAGALPGNTIRHSEGFKVEMVYDVPRSQGSWVSLAVDDKGRLYASDQGNAGLYRITLDEAGKASVEKMQVNMTSAQGLTWAFDSLYFCANGGPGSGLYRLRDTTGDDQFDQVDKLRALSGGGEHGPHDVELGPDGKQLYIVAGNSTKTPNHEKTLVPPVWQEDQLLARMPDARGHARRLKAPGGWIARTDREGETWEFFTTGFRNSYGIAFNQDDELFTYDSDMEWDAGTPWYRPTRICHAVSGGEFGWRNGSGKFPPYYADTLPAVVDVGPGSPTGVTSGAGTKFPAKYQKAVFALDWTYGSIWAVHLKPEGAGYVAEREEFVGGKPLPVTDAVVHPKDGAFYFAVGGRRAKSFLYRVTYVGEKSTAPVSGKNAEGAEARALRRKLEALHRPGNSSDLAALWPSLGSEDRYLRNAARIALEHQPVDSWENKALAERDPQTLLTALTALARNGSTDLRDGALDALGRLDWVKLTETQQLHLLRNYGLVFLRLGRPDPKQASVIVNKLDPHYPAGSDALNRELCTVLTYLEAPTVPAKTIPMLAQNRNEQDEYLDESLLARSGYGRAFQATLASRPEKQQIHYAYCLRVAKAGWTPALRKSYFRWFNNAKRFKGGNSFAGFLNNIRKEALAHTPEAERASLSSLNEELTTSAPAELPRPKGPGRIWTTEDVAKLVTDKGLEGRDLTNGQAMFRAGLCANCHRFKGEGGIGGPDLTGSGGRFSPSDLADAILNPNNVISDQYHNSLLSMIDGSEQLGRVLGEEDGHLLVMPTSMAPDHILRIPKAKVKATTPSKISPMMPGLVNAMNPDEVLDLLAYLRSGVN